MPDPTVVFGVAGFTVTAFGVAIKVLWTALQAERAARVADQQAILPALTQSTSAVASAVVAIDRITVLYEHRALGPGPPGDGR